MAEVIVIKGEPNTGKTAASRFVKEILKRELCHIQSTDHAEQFAWSFFGGLITHFVYSSM
ncbi:MAG: hypothetical protein J6R16_06415 [Alistipes sp.]|nr:hypothetical protein [Alistipes sp.]